VCHTTLGSVGVAIASAVVAAFVVLIPVVLFFSSPANHHPPDDGMGPSARVMPALPLDEAGGETDIDRQPRETSGR